MKATLRSLENGHEFVLAEHDILGRGPQASIRVPHPSVSREHASIQRNAGLFWLRDLKSANGTSINGIALTSPRVLRHGDRLQFGACVFVFEDADAQRPSTRETSGISTAALPLKTVKATLLVGDLQNFAGISAQLSATQVADMLREWYEDCDKVLKSRGATIDKFLGDGIIAYWPDTSADTRRKATEAARMFTGAAASQLPQRRELRETRSIEVVCHVGLHVGEVALGPLVRGVSTIIGRNLMLTSSIEAFTRRAQVPVLAGAAFLEDWPEGLALYQSVGVHTVKDKFPPLELFKLADAE